MQTINAAQSSCSVHSRRALVSTGCSSARQVLVARQQPLWRQQQQQQHATLQQQQQRRLTIAAASKEDEEVERMKREINQGDVWDSEFVSTALKVALVAGVVAVGIFLFNVGRPIVDNTLSSFPSPEMIQAYEDSK